MAPAALHDAAAPAASTEIPFDTDQDSWRIIFLLLVSTVTAIAVVLALWAGSALDTSWALVGVMAVHFTTTAIVFAVVEYVMTGRWPFVGRGRRDP